MKCNKNIKNKTKYPKYKKIIVDKKNKKMFTKSKICDMIIMYIKKV